MDIKPILVHVTHEAASKIGGIGAVFDGLFTCQSYLDAVERSIVIGPLFTFGGPAHDIFGESGEILYSSVHGIFNTEYATAFRQIEDYHKVGLIYGKRTFVDSQTGITSRQEVILIDVRSSYPGIINHFKGQMFQHFGIHSELYEHLWEYEQYVRLGPPTMALLKAMGAATDNTFVISHEYMGMPTVMAAMLDTECKYKTAFYAHEVATMRRIVEHEAGHDTMFYNVMRKAHEKKLYVDDVFGSQEEYFKHPLVEASKYCDVILAVGDLVADELRFLAPQFENKNIAVVYNGIHAYKITLKDKLKSKEKLQQYCFNLLGYQPDYIFSHVTRMVLSKGLWRDLRVLEHIDGDLRRAGKKAVMYLISTEVGQRRSHEIHEMESRYNWPIEHREGWPDLSGGEAGLNKAIQGFNAKSTNVKVVFINQFGFSRKCCGKKMPENMGFIDIRKGTDVEFGQSIYEPFGIAPVEPLTFGGICVFSSVSGCAGFVSSAIAGIKPAGNEGVKNVVIADYTAVNGRGGDIAELLKIGKKVRDEIEGKVGKAVADEIMDVLPKNDTETAEMIENGQRIANNMSWDAVVGCYLMPSLESALESERFKKIKAVG